MDFVPLSDVFYRLVGYHAFHEFAERPEGITVDDIEAVASYCAKLASHQERLRIQKKRIASGRRVSAPTNQNWPDCPDIVRHFLNMLVIRGKSIDASRRVILGYITTGWFPSYVLDKNGVATRLEPRNFKNNRYNSHAPFHVRISPFDNQETLVHVLEADLEYFVEHGRLKSEDPATTVEQGETGPTPPDTATGGVNSKVEGKAKRTFSKSKVRDWYTKRVKEWPPDERPPSRDEDIRAAKEEFDVTEMFIRDLRNELAPTEWTSKRRPKAQ